MSVYLFYSGALGVHNYPYLIPSFWHNLHYQFHDTNFELKDNKQPAWKTKDFVFRKCVQLGQRKMFILRKRQMLRLQPTSKKEQGVGFQTRIQSKHIVNIFIHVCKHTTSIHQQFTVGFAFVSITKLFILAIGKFHLRCRCPGGLPRERKEGDQICFRRLATYDAKIREYRQK